MGSHGIGLTQAEHNVLRAIQTGQANLVGLRRLGHTDEELLRILQTLRDLGLILV